MNAYLIDIENEESRAEYVFQKDGNSFSITLDTITANEKEDDSSYLTIASISVNGEELCNSLRCRPNKLIIPFDYKSKYGNFLFNCINDEVPYYEKFGLTQFLYYIPAEEL